MLYIDFSLSLPLSFSLQPLTPRELKVIKQQQKLLEKLQKKAQKEADRRRQQEDKKRRRDRKGKKGKVSIDFVYIGYSFQYLLVHHKISIQPSRLRVASSLGPLPAYWRKALHKHLFGLAFIEFSFFFGIPDSDG